MARSHHEPGARLVASLHNLPDLGEQVISGCISIHLMAATTAIFTRCARKLGNSCGGCGGGVECLSSGVVVPG